MNIIIFVILFFMPSFVYAGEGLDARVRATQQQREVYQQQIQQRAIQQQQQQVIQQTVAQRQAALRQAALAQQQAAYQATLQQYQQEVYRQQASAYQQVAANQTAQIQQQLAHQQAVQQAAYQQAMGVGGGAMPPNLFPPMEAAETTTMEEVWSQLEQSSHLWSQIMDMDAKEVIIVKFIQDLREEGSYIKKPAAHYAQLIDQMSFENPEMLINPFKNILQIVAIMEYDLDNGIDKETLARQVLGDQAYQSNLRRLGR